MRLGSKFRNSMIKNLFLKCGISNFMDVSEVDALFVDNAGGLENGGGDQVDNEAHTENNDFTEDPAGNVQDDI